MKASDIKKALGHKLLGNGYLKSMVIRALQKLPSGVLENVCIHCWFVGSFDGGWAFTLRADELKKGECLIFLGDELMDEDEDQIIWTIIHEIGHVILGHRNSIGEVQAKSETREQEKEANLFALRLLRRSGL